MKTKTVWIDGGNVRIMEDGKQVARFTKDEEEDCRNYLINSGMWGEGWARAMFAVNDFYGK